MISIVSLSLLVFFFAVYKLKLGILKFRGIKGYHLAQSGKVSSLQEKAVFLASAFGFSVWGAAAVFDYSSRPFPFSLQIPSAVSFFGIVVTAFGIGIFCAAMIAMKNSWRIGIDRSSKTALVSRGVYSLSRNPAFLGFDIAFAGILFTFPGFLTLAALAGNAVSLHFLVLKEEEHWIAIGGKDYDRYRKRVPRYFSFKKRAL